MNKLKSVWNKIKTFAFRRKKRFYIILVIVCSFVLLADLGIGMLMPDMSSSYGTMQDSSGGPGGDSDSSGSGDEDFDVSEMPEGGDFEGEAPDLDGSGAESGGSSSGEDADDSSDADSSSDEEDSSSDSSDSTDSSDSSSDSAENDLADASGDSSGAPSGDFSGGGMPEMGDSDGEMPEMDGSQGEMGQPGEGGPDSEDGDSSSDDSGAESADSDADSSSGDSQQAGGRGGMLRVLQAVKAHWILILVIAAVLDGGSIFMLVQLRRRKKEEEIREEEAHLLEDQQSADGEVHLARPEKKKKKAWKIWLVVIIVIIVVVAAARIAASRRSSDSSETESTVYESTAELSDISTVLPGTGTLEEEDAVEVSLPSEVEILEWYVEDGDTVEEGDKLALVDTDTALSAIASVQEVLTSLDEAVAEAEDGDTEGSVTATAGGRVKAVFAESGMDVLETIYESEALMLLSLDGLMAVDVETDADISAGDSVTVALTDDTEVEGTVESVKDGTAVVTLTDDGTTYGSTVTVTDAGGNEVGTGTLYIHSELAVMAFSGTVSEISVSVGDEVESGDTLMTLTDIDNTLEIELLLEQREDLEDQMQTLFQLYQDGYLYADTAGVVSGLSSDGDSDSDTEDSDASEDDSESSGSSSEDSSEDSSTSDADSSSTDSTSDTDSSSSGESDDSASSGGLVLTTADVSSESGTAAVTFETSENTSVTYSGNSYSVLTLTSETDSSGDEGASDSGDGSSSGSGESADESAGADGGDASDGADGSDSDDSSEDSSSPDTDSSSDSAEDSDDGSGSSYASYIGTVMSVDGNTLTVSLYSIDGSSLSGSSTSSAVDLGGAGIYSYSDGSLESIEASDLSAGDTLILLCESGSDAGSLNPICAIRVEAESSEETAESSAAGEFSGGEAGESESGTADITGGSSEEQLQGSVDTITGLDESSASALEEALSGSVSSESELAAAETAVAETLTEEVETSYSVDETTWLAVTPQDSMYITITIDELDILSLEEGLEAEVTLDAFPGQSFTGTVESISLSGSNEGGNSKYTAEVRIDRGDDMLAGMNASVKITLDTEEDVLCVPADAIQEDESGTYVYTSYDEKTETFGDAVYVETGISDGENVEIVSGLSEGDEYCYSVLDTVNYSSSSASGSGGFRFGGFGGGGGGGGQE